MKNIEFKFLALFGQAVIGKINKNFLKKTSPVLMGN
jgi:hypothetical protein